ncbi:alanyl-tRNA synthetase mitochondrial precursor [Tribonema minus]|uniref:Alanine--tRNA ligase n=1 Tax=Tribonema minus TaxID=303371 RepID=A0A835ZLN6_9STRA|nr:alanyl-tRNA synthetase mitochondrial precursor [Tribonema minus]
MSIGGQQRQVTTSSLKSAPDAATAVHEWNAARVRQTFIDYFSETKAHTFYPSSPVVPHDDPTLLFANAGMNQFKPIFLGQVDPRSPLAALTRAVNTQKCIRAGGKHNDLEDVGRDTYHHTFFEMLGTWSFGDYFKEEAIEWAWDILTRVYALPPDRLYATYFGGDEAMGLPADNEARDFWLKVLPADRILPFDRKANFWEMGDVGPCGPCSELHFDRIGGRDASALVNMDDPNVLEIWNLVFIQFNREPDGTLKTLPAKHIDTGMGLERLVSVLQSRSSNYDTDLFAPLFDAIHAAAGGAPYGGRLGAEDAGLRDTAYRVVADHARTLTFALADGAVPSNEGRGYVLRRILRRAVRYGQQILGAPEGFFQELVPVVVRSFSAAFPELKGQEAAIRELVTEEEASFSKMLERGIKFLGEVQAEQRASGSRLIPGDKAFFLYDTMGFPVDLTQLMAAEQGLSVDMEGFEAEMAEQRRRSREATRKQRADGGAALVFEAEETAWLAARGVAPTDDAAKYGGAPLSATVRAIFTADGFVESAGAEDGEVGVVLDRTCFYAESGGQVGDAGALVAAGGGDVEVVDVQTFGGYSVHLGRVRSGALKVGDSVEASVNAQRRARVAPNHTMTHVLNFALREVLGDGVAQRGSLVSDERLRFDFSHARAVAPRELERVEALVQECVAQALPVYSQVVPLEQAKAINGLRAVFGEAYPDPVRVVSVGGDIGAMLADPARADWARSSVEFCGGTHLANTADAAAFALVQEEAVAKGVRRITAVTGAEAAAALAEGAKLQADVAAAAKLADAELEADAPALRQALDAATISAALKAKLRGEVEALQRRAAAAAKAAAAAAADRGVAAARAAAEAAAAAGARSLVTEVAIGGDSKAVKRVLDAVQAAAPELAFMGLSPAAGADGRLLCFALCGDAARAAGLGADAWVAAAMAACGGRGGGKPSAAQGQAPSVEGLQAAADASKAFAAQFGL